MAGQYLKASKIPGMNMLALYLKMSEEKDKYRLTPTINIKIPRVVNSFQHDSYNNSENVKIPTETTALKEKQCNTKRNSNSTRHIHARYANIHSTLQVTGHAI